MVHFNYSHLTRSKKLEEFISDSLSDLMQEESHISTVYCFLSRTFDNRDKLISTLKMQIRLKSQDSITMEQSASNFKAAFKTMKPELTFMFNESRESLASA
ncbi:hypothetical protein [Nonlabens antarcticus]|uniref:hypothetical protein n=1 Tax=Nonlabens antarcticus TaxID=392714 RepID=UPI001891F2BF|nr:hypothetical protein [Nonlabens antarcticus]